MEFIRERFEPELSDYNVTFIHDKDDLFAVQNNLSDKDKIYRTLFTNKDRELILIGNPIYHKILHQLYEKVITDTLAVHADRYRTAL